ncbi:MAG: NYN domain-containing protein [Gemmatimonadaceae bacterium]
MAAEDSGQAGEDAREGKTPSRASSSAPRPPGPAKGAAERAAAQDAANNGAAKRAAANDAATDRGGANDAERPPVDERLVLIDGSNVAHSSEGEKARLANIILIEEKIREDGMEPVIVADAALRHQIDRRADYERLVDAGRIKQAPAGTDADYFILSFARELGASIVSNDRYRDRIARYPEVEERIIRYMIVADEVVLERRGRRRD